MRILENDIYRDMTEEEVAELYSNEQPIQQSKDNLTALAEGLSTATTISQIRAVAQSILDETDGTE